MSLKHTVVGVYINTMTTTFWNIKIYLLFPIYTYSFFKYIQTQFMLGQGALYFSEREGSIVQILYDLFPNVVVTTYCIDIYAEHRTLGYLFYYL